MICPTSITSPTRWLSCIPAKWSNMRIRKSCSPARNIRIEALLSAVPKPDPTAGTELIVPEGEVPNPANPPSGCHFHLRCPYRTELCMKVKPAVRPAGNGGFVACHCAEELNLSGIKEIAAGREEVANE